MMREASVLGSPQAQFYLGNRYETGNGVPREMDRARRYFRLCAAQEFPRASTGWEAYYLTPLTDRNATTCKQ
jgi:TPR repeat protein